MAIRYCCRTAMWMRTRKAANCLRSKAPPDSCLTNSAYKKSARTQSEGKRALSGTVSTKRSGSSPLQLQLQLQLNLCALGEDGNFRAREREGEDRPKILTSSWRRSARTCRACADPGALTCRPMGSSHEVSRQRRAQRRECWKHPSRHVPVLMINQRKLMICNYFQLFIFITNPAIFDVCDYLVNTDESNFRQAAVGVGDAECRQECGEPKLVHLISRDARDPCSQDHRPRRLRAPEAHTSAARPRSPRDPRASRATAHGAGGRRAARRCGERE